MAGRDGRHAQDDSGDGAADGVRAAMEWWSAWDPALPGETMEIVIRLARLGDRIAAEVEAAHRGAGLEPGDFDVLATLLRGGPASPTELARALMLSKAGMSGRLERLRRRELVDEQPRADDRRGKSIALADRGRELVESTVHAHAAAEERALAGLTAADRAQLLALLRRAAV